MRVLDESNNVLETYDLEKGYLIEEKFLVKHHEAQVEVVEVGHYETVAEYLNGGKDVEWVIDTPGVPAKEAWDEYEDILRYIPYTEKELAQIDISKFKSKLAETDYVVIKIAEGAATREEYEDIIQQRIRWRTLINELELIVAD